VAAVTRPDVVRSRCTYIDTVNCGDFWTSDFVYVVQSHCVTAATLPTLSEHLRTTILISSATNERSSSVTVYGSTFKRLA